MRKLLAAAALGALAVAPAQAGEIAVGSVGGITGPIAELVAPIMAGRALAAAHVNENGGVLGGDMLVMVPGDSQCDPKAAVDAGNKVVNVDRVVAIVGPNCSGATNAMTQSVTIPAGIPSVSDSATAPSISELEDNGLVFRVAPSDAYQGATLARYAYETLGFRRLAMTYANDDYNAGIAAVFARVFDELGGEIQANQVHEPNKASYRAEVSTLGGGGAEALALFAYYGGSGIAILRNSLETGAFGKFIGADGMLDQSVIDQLGADTLRGNIWLTTAAADPEQPSFKAFAEAYTASGGADPGAPYVANGYDATFVIALAIEAAGAADGASIARGLTMINDPGGEVVGPGDWATAKAALAAGKAVNYRGASGSVDFDANGDVPGIYSVSVVGDDGKWAPTLLK